MHYLINSLKKSYRAVAPDHMGCGLSDKPSDYPYTLKQHIDNLTSLIDALGLEKMTLVMHDWGGAIGMGYAGRYPEKIDSLIVLNTAAFTSTRIPLRISICRLPWLGGLLVRGLNGFAGPAVRMAVTKPMAPEVAAGYLMPYDSWGNRVAIHAFVKDIPMSKGHPSWSTLWQIEQNLEKLADHPMLVLWGAKDFCFNDHFYREWQQRFPKAQCHYFPEAGHYVLEDAFADIEPLIKSFLKEQLSRG